MTLPGTPAMSLDFPLSAVSCVQICAGAGMVYMAAGVVRRPVMVVVSRLSGSLLTSAREEERG